MFLSDAYNKAKGLTFDQENKDKRFIALTITEDFYTKLYQISIKFNYPATLVLERFEKPAVIELAYLLYEWDYCRVIIEAQNILLEYKEAYTFSPEKLRALDYHIEGCVGKTLPVKIYEEYLNGKHEHAVCIMHRIAPLKTWTKDVEEKYFIITDIDDDTRYRIEL